jgi:DNA-binding NtrC family response regulator
MSKALTYIRQDDISSHREMRSTAMPLSARIAAINRLVASLNAAVDELESFQLPPLNETFDFYDEVRRFEVSLIRKALKMTRGSQVRAAELLKLNATTLNTKIKHYGISTHDR